MDGSDMDGFNDLTDEDQMTVVKRSDEFEENLKDINDKLDNSQRNHDSISNSGNNKIATVVGKKRGRPSCKGAAAKEWRDDEIFSLIDLWESHNILYDTKHSMYYNKPERDNAVKSIKNSLNDMNIQATSEQIYDKMTNLKCYYGSQKRQTEQFKAQPGSQYRDYVSPWKFYSKLTFLNGTFVKRLSNQRQKSEEGVADSNRSHQVKKSKQRKDEMYDIYDSKATMIDPYKDSKYMSESFIQPPTNGNKDVVLEYNGQSPNRSYMQSPNQMMNDPPFWTLDQSISPVTAPSPIAVSAISLSNGINSNHHHQQQNRQQQQQQQQHQQQQQNVATITPAVRSSLSNSLPNPALSIDVKKSEDACFCELMFKMLDQVPECEEKAMLKLEFQQKVISLRYRKT